MKYDYVAAAATIVASRSDWNVSEPHDLAKNVIALAHLLEWHEEHFLTGANPDDVSPIQADRWARLMPQSVEQV